jgi:hypothetical protein
MQIYGYAHPMQSKEYQEQRKQRCLAVHGVGHHSQVEEFKERKRQSMLNTHGVENAMQSAEFRERNIQSNIRTRESKINNEIFKGDFGRFEYLWDTVDEVFLMGVYESLSRNQEGRYTKVAANKKFKVFVDVLRMTLHQIDVTKFSKPLPANFVLKGSSFPE